MTVKSQSSINGEQHGAPSSQSSTITSNEQQGSRFGKKIYFAIGAVAILIIGGIMWSRSGSKKTPAPAPSTAAAPTAKKNPVNPAPKNPSTPSSSAASTSAPPKPAAPRPAAAAAQGSKTRPSAGQSPKTGLLKRIAPFLGLGAILAIIIAVIAMKRKKKPGKNKDTVDLILDIAIVASAIALVAIIIVLIVKQCNSSSATGGIDSLKKLEKVDEKGNAVAVLTVKGLEKGNKQEAKLFVSGKKDVSAFIKDIGQKIGFKGSKDLEQVVKFEGATYEYDTTSKDSLKITLDVEDSDVAALTKLVGEYDDKIQVNNKQLILIVTLIGGKDANDKKIDDAIKITLKKTAAGSNVGSKVDVTFEDKDEVTLLKSIGGIQKSKTGKITNAVLGDATKPIEVSVDGVSHTFKDKAEADKHIVAKETKIAAFNWVTLKDKTKLPDARKAEIEDEDSKQMCQIIKVTGTTFEVKSNKDGKTYKWSEEKDLDLIQTFHGLLKNARVCVKTAAIPGNVAGTDLTVGKEGTVTKVDKDTFEVKVDKVDTPVVLKNDKNLKFANLALKNHFKGESITNNGVAAIAGKDAKPENELPPTAQGTVVSITEDVVEIEYTLPPATDKKTAKIHSLASIRALFTKPADFFKDQPVLVTKEVDATLKQGDEKKIKKVENGDVTLEGDHTIKKADVTKTIKLKVDSIDAKKGMNVVVTEEVKDNGKDIIPKGTGKVTNVDGLVIEVEIDGKKYNITRKGNTKDLKDKVKFEEPPAAKKEEDKVSEQPATFIPDVVAAINATYLKDGKKDAKKE